EGRRGSREEIDALMDESARNGDPRAIAFTLAMTTSKLPFDPMPTAEMLLDSHDPYVYRHIAPILAGKTGSVPLIDGVPMREADRPRNLAHLRRRRRCDPAGAAPAGAPAFLRCRRRHHRFVADVREGRVAARRIAAVCEA